MKAISLKWRTRLADVFFSSENTLQQSTRKKEKQATASQPDNHPLEIEENVAMWSKAYTGNFFAGSTCVFDPRLLPYTARKK